MNDVAIMKRKEVSNHTLAYKIEGIIKKLPQIDLTTYHTLHAGIYQRTIKLEAGTVISGVLIKIDTVLTIIGDMKVLVGDKVKDVKGFAQISAPANRKQILTAITQSYVIMAFSTLATSIEEAERDFTNEYDMLISRNKHAINIRS